jgi:hypothetical protein
LPEAPWTPRLLPVSLPPERVGRVRTEAFPEPQSNWFSSFTPGGHQPEDGCQRFSIGRSANTPPAEPSAGAGSAEQFRPAPVPATGPRTFLGRREWCVATSHSAGLPLSENAELSGFHFPPITFAVARTGRSSIPIVFSRQQKKCPLGAVDMLQEYWMAMPVRRRERGR